MPKIWFRIGMEADVTQEELDALRRGKDESLMLSIISKAEVSGETYIPSLDNGNESYDNPVDEISFLF